LRRKAYPFVIDKKATDPNSNYTVKMLNTYIDKSAKVSVTANISNYVAIGSQTIIEANTNI
jgi:UDP-3-O-[3-hydroxymyristoyl] glucosamine N-acyltransferase